MTTTRIGRIALVVLALGVCGPGTPGSEEGSRASQGSARGPHGQFRCLSPSGDAIPAGVVLEDLLDGKDVDLEGCLVEGNLDLDGLWPPATEDVSSLRIVPGRLRLSSCRILGSVTLRDAVLVQGLDLSCSEIRGDLDLSGSHLLGGLAARRSRAAGGIRIEDAVVEGDLTLDEATVDLTLTLSGGRVGSRLGLAGLRAGRDVELSRMIVGTLALDDARLARGATLRDVLVLSDLTASDAVFSRGLLIETARVAGRASLDGARGPGGIVLSHLDVGADLVLSLQADGPLEVLDTTVGHDLTLWDGNFEDVTLSRVFVGRGTELEEARFAGRLLIEESDLGQTVSADDARFLGEAVFRAVRLPGDDPLQGARFARPPTIIETDLAHAFDLAHQDEEVDAIDEFDLEFDATVDDDE